MATLLCSVNLVLNGLDGVGTLDSRTKTYLQPLRACAYTQKEAHIHTNVTFSSRIHSSTNRFHHALMSTNTLAWCTYTFLSVSCAHSRGKKQPDEQADRQGWANWSVLDWMLNKWMPLCRWINRNTLVKRKQSLYSVDNTEFQPKPTPPLAWENHYPFEILRVKILYMLTHTICVCVCAKIEVHCVENARCGESPRAASSQTNVRINRSSRRLARRRLSPYPSFADLMERDT